MRKNTTVAENERKGSIICTASNAGIYPFPIAPMYSTTKHGVIGAVRSLARNLEKEGIQINAICPNCIGTYHPFHLLNHTYLFPIPHAYHISIQSLTHVSIKKKKVPS